MSSNPKHRNHQAPNAPRWTRQVNPYANKRLQALQAKYGVTGAVAEAEPDLVIDQRPALREKLEDWLQPYDAGSDASRESALIPLLQKAQALLGYLPKWAIQDIADRLNMPHSAVYGVATFYAQFRMKPQGRNVIKVCMGTACHVRGGAAILQAVREQLGIGPGETTPDLEFSVERVACLGACGLAPVVVLNDEAHGRMDADAVKELLEDVSNNGNQVETAD